MAAAKKGAVALSETGFVKEVTKRLNAVTGAEFAEKEVKLIVRAIKEEAIDCLINGYSVSLTGLVKLTPVAVAEKPKGEMVRNPFDGTVKPRPAAVPASFKVKAAASASVKAAFPTTRTNAGKLLLDQLTPAAKKATPAKAAPTKTKTATKRK